VLIHLNRCIDSIFRDETHNKGLLKFILCTNLSYIC
jgi:hypothetical protein